MNLAHLQEAQARLEASAEPLLLESPKDALSIFGVLWFVELDRTLREKYPDRYLGMEIDAGSRADLAHAALREGLKFLRFSGQADAARALQDIARQKAGKVRFLAEQD